MSDRDQSLPNARLRTERERRNWTLQQVADHLFDLCVAEGRKRIGINADIVGRWERGVSRPTSHYRAKLCQLYGMTAEELGLLDELAAHDQEEMIPPDISHIVGREDVIQQQLIYLETSPSKPRVKLSIMYGITGAGKTSVLKLLCNHLASQKHCDLYFYPFRHAQDKTPAEYLDIFLADMLHWFSVPQPDAPTLPPLAERISHLMKKLVERNQPLILVLDDLQIALEPGGTLATEWQHFLQAFIEADHAATIYAASRESLWHGRERVFLRETELEPLSPNAGVEIWRNLGFVETDETLLRQATEKCGSNPGMMEIVAQHVQRPVPSLAWQPASASGEAQEAQRLAQFVDDPHILSHHLAIDAYPLIDEIVRTQLSLEARDLLQVLAMAPVPLASALLSHLSPSPECAYADLRRTTLLSQDHVRLALPSLVVESVRQQLTDEQVAQIEHRLINIYTLWVKQGIFLADDEQGAVVTELVALCFKYCRLVDAAEHLIYYGWLSFNRGHGPRLARLVEQAMLRCHWQDTLSTECAGLLLQDMLLPFLGQTTDALWRINHESVCAAFLAKTIELPMGATYALMHALMLNAINALHFEEAQAILDTYVGLEVCRPLRLDQDPSFLGERAFLVGTWCEYAKEQGEKDKAKTLREQVIALYRQYVALLDRSENTPSSARESLHKRAMAYGYHYLGYELGKNGQYEESLSYIDRNIVLKEQGYVYVGGLASAYSDKAQILMEVGRFQEALSFDEKAFAEIQRCVATGDVLSQEELRMYQVNRGRLYLRLGRIEEAERLLREARPHIHERRRMYRMFAQQAIDEIEQWRKQATSPCHQLDWRWIGRFRDLVAYDGHGWLAHAGPFTEEEQQQWDRLFVPDADEAIWEQLAALMVQSRKRELAAAIAEQREPQLRYPAIDIEAVRGRMVGLLALDAEIEQEEPNAIVRRLYHGAIEDELTFLRLIEATYEGNTETFWACNLRSFPLPTLEEVNYALLPIKQEIQQGLRHAATREAACQLSEWMHAHLHLSPEPPSNTKPIEETHPNEPVPSSPMISTQAARKFFETALQMGSCNEWRVAVDPKAIHPRVESGLRTFFLSPGPYRLEEVRYWFIHELVGHIGRSTAGEGSPLGLLGMSTKNYLLTEEGWNHYHESRIEALHGQHSPQPELWIGTITTGLASGVMTPPQSFSSLYTFFSLYASLDQLLQYLDADIQTVRQQAQEYALHICLRTFRGVPDLERTGVCYLKDAIYLHGTRMIEEAVAEDKTVLDRLAVGKVSLEVLPDLQELGITSAPQLLRQLAYDPDLDARILSFEQIEQVNRQADPLSPARKEGD